MEKNYLLIPYDKKDEFKQQYKIKWDIDKKLWYFEGELIEELKPYTIKKIQVEYEDKDFMKKRFKSMRWITHEKTWICSFEDYQKFMHNTNSIDIELKCR